MAQAPECEVFDKHRCNGRTVMLMAVRKRSGYATRHQHLCKGCVEAVIRGGFEVAEVEVMQARRC